MYDKIQRCFTEGRFGGGHLYIEGLGRIKSFGGLIPPNYDIFEKLLNTPLHILFTHPNKQQTRDMAKSFYTFYDEITQKTPGQFHSEAIDVEKEAAELIEGNILLEIRTPAIHRIHALSYRYKTAVEATLMIIAILRYNQDTGDYPENLEQLVTAGFLKEIPLDSFSDNKPLVYKKTEDSFVLYSVGMNYTDDSGQVVRNAQGKVKNWALEGDEVFWPVTK
jgi:hypothetical protein